MYHLLVCLLIILAPVSVANAQLQQYLFSHIGPNNGLASEHVLSVQQDRKGFIWISTFNGLQRYDGQRFLGIRRGSNGVPLPEGMIHNLLLDKNDRLWMIMDGMKVGYLNTLDFSFHNVTIDYPKEKREKAGGGLYVDADGDVLLVLTANALFKYDESRATFSSSKNNIALPGNWKPYYLWQDGQRNYWIGTDSGLVKYNPRNKSISFRNNNADGDSVIEAFADLRQVVFAYRDPLNTFWGISWPASKLTIRSYDPATNRKNDWDQIIGKALSNKYYAPRGVHATRDGNIWIWGHNLFGKVMPETKNIEIIRNDIPGEFSIRYDNISMIFEDRESNIWISSDKGLFRFNPAAQKFQVLRNRRPGNDSIYTPDVTDVLQTRNGNILVSTWGSGVFSYDSNLNPIKTAISSQGEKAGEGLTWCIHERKNGDVVRGNQDGYIFIYRAASNTTEKIRPAVFENSTVRQVVEDKTGKLWFGTQRGYIVKWDPDTDSWTLVQKLQSTIARLLVDSLGNIWASTSSNGVYHINAKNSKVVKRYTGDDEPGKALRSNSSSDILQYDDSTMVIAANGLNFVNLHSGDIRHFSFENGLPTNDIGNLAKDKKGFIWISSGLGILNHQPKKSKVSSYNATDGVHTNSFSTASVTSFYDGRIAIGTSHDVIIFDPAEVRFDNYIPPKVEISGISVMNKYLPTDSIEKEKVLTLRHDQNSILVEFTTLTYQNLYGIYYKLEGLEDEWNETGVVKQAVYSYLPAGNYELKIATYDLEGKPGQITSLPIVVKAPFWRSTWFYSLLALSLAGGLYWLDRQRQVRVKSEWQMRSAIAGNLHEDVNSTLQNINVLSEIAGMKASTDPEKSKEFIYDIQQKSRNMVIAMNDVLWSIDPANDSMPKTIERIHEVAHAMRSRHGATVLVNIEKNVSELNFNMKFRHEFIIIYKLAIVSLVELSHAKLTRINLDFEKGLLLLSLNAPGTNMERKDHVLNKNIAEMEARARTISALLTIKDDNSGSTITIKVRIEKNGSKKI